MEEIKIVADEQPKPGVDIRQLNELIERESSFVDLMELKETLLAADTFFRKVSIGYQVRVYKTD